MPKTGKPISFSTFAAVFNVHDSAFADRLSDLISQWEKYLRDDEVHDFVTTEILGISKQESVRGVCDACGYETEIEEYGPAFGELYNRLGRRSRFCQVCASTFISQVETNPTNLMNPLFFYRTLGRVANMILDAIKELKTGRLR